MPDTTQFLDDSPPWWNFIFLPILVVLLSVGWVVTKIGDGLRRLFG